MCAAALIEHPQVNSQLIDSQLHQYSRADISVVIALEDGLSTPVVRGANEKGVREIAAEIRALAARAAAGKLRMEKSLVVPSASRI